MIDDITRLAGPYTGAGLTQLTFGFKIFEPTDVYVATSMSSEVVAETTLEYGTDYSVTMNADQDATPGGYVTLTNAMVDGQIVVIGSGIAYTQNTQLTNYSRFPPSIINDALDRIVVQIQQIVEKLGRAILVPPTSSITPMGLLKQIFQAAKSAAEDAEDAAAALAACEEIQQYITKYSWDIPHLVDSLRDVENYPYDGFFVVGGYGNAGGNGQNISNRYVKAEGSTELRTLGERFADVVNVKDFGAKGDGVTDDTEAFNSAASVGPAYVPKGTYRLSNPYDLGLKAKFFGPGKIVFTNAEHRRRGGSSGGVDVPERYTLFYLYENKTDVSITFNGVSQEFSWLTDTTIQAPGSEYGVDVRINIANGYRYLGSVPESLRVFSTYESGGDLVEPSDDPASIAVGNNVSFGPLALRDLISGGNNVAFGSKALMTASTGGNNVAMGYQALYRSNGNNNTALGCIAGEWLENGDANTFVGSEAGSGLREATGSTALGYSAFAEGGGDYTTAVGYRALGNCGIEACDSSTAVGAFAGDFAYGNSNTFLGYRAGNGDATHYSDGEENVGIGFMAMRNHHGADKNVVIGSAAAMNITNQQENVCIGFGAGINIAGNKSVIIGSQSALSANSGTVAIGNQVVPNATGAGLTVVGNNAGFNLTTGENNTFIGANAGRFDFDGNPTQTVNGCTALGENARVDGDNQLQLGNSTTNVYVYGSVQSRSDQRDKADIRDCVLGLEFINSLRPVDFRWDLRDDYTSFETSTDDAGNEIISTIRLTRDGSKKRTRFHHGFIAQDLEELIQKTGVDFGGYQDHSVNGGGDVKSLGYEEFIAPMVKAIQELSSRIEALEKRMTIVEAQ